MQQSTREKDSRHASPVRQRQVYTIGSQSFMTKFPELAPKTGAPTSSKRGLFRKLSSLMGGKEQRIPRGEEQQETSDELQTITYCDTDILGEGACAVVVRAKLNNVDVAAKILKKPSKYKSDVYSMEEAKASLIKEIELLAGLNHPNIVGLLGVFYEGADVVMVQQLMRCSLKEYMNQQASTSGTTYWDTPESVVLNWSSNIYNVLAFLHSQKPPIVHRDIKPDNLLVDCNLNLRLGDLGLSRRCDGERTLEERYAMTGCCGSLRYMAPEVQDEDSEGVAYYSEKVDVYSTSMVIFFIASGHPPFHRLTADTAAATSIRGGRPTLGEVQKKYNPFITSLIRQGWSQSVRRRPSAQKLYTDIQRFRSSYRPGDTSGRPSRLQSPIMRSAVSTQDWPSKMPAMIGEEGNERISRRRSLSPTRWIGSVLSPKSDEIGLVSPVHGAVSPIGSMRLLDRVVPSSPEMSRSTTTKRLTMPSFSGFFRGGRKGAGDAGTGSGTTSPTGGSERSMLRDLGENDTEPQSKGGSSNFLRTLSPSRIFSSRSLYSSGANTPVSPVASFLGSSRQLCSDMASPTSSDEQGSPKASSPNLSRNMLNYKIESDITFPAAKARLSPLSSLLPVKTVESDLPESDLDGAHVHPAPSTGRNTRTSAMARKSTPEGSPVVTTLPTPSADKIRTLARSSTDSQNRQTASIFSWTQDDTKSEGASSSERGPESPDSPNNRKYLQDASASPLFNMKKR